MGRLAIRTGCEIDGLRAPPRRSGGSARRADLGERWLRAWHRGRAMTHPRTHFHADLAPSLARSAVPPGLLLERAPSPPGWRVSQALSLLTDPGRSVLVVVLSPGEARSTWDLALATGLALKGDRDLRLVVPDETWTLRSLGEVPAWRRLLWRLPWLRSSVRLFTYGLTADEGAVLTERLPPARCDVEAALVREEALRLEPHDLGEGAGYVAGLVAWADAHPHLVPIVRESYRSWHVLGRCVLKLQRGASGTVDMVAGVPFEVRPGWAQAADERRLDGPVEGVALTRLQALVEAFVSARLDGRDAAGAEHILQARLATPEGRAALGVVGPLLREVPASRPCQRRAYIDLLGVGPDGRLLIVETKLGRDHGVVLQALDYWIWASARLRELRAHLEAAGAPRGRRGSMAKELVLVVDPQGKRHVHESILAQARWLAGDVRLRLVEVGEVEGALRLRRVHPFQLRGGRDGETLACWELDLEEGRRARLPRGGMSRGPFLRDPGLALPDAAVAELTRLREAGLDHPMQAHLRSSQAFALALFAGLGGEALLPVARRLLPGLVDLDAPCFEWIDALDRVGEGAAGGRHRTQVDVALFGRDAAGSRLGLLVEVKLSEEDLNGCRSAELPLNPDRSVCRGDTPFGVSRESCFSLCNNGYGDGSLEQRRRYDRWISAAALPQATGPAGVGPGCPFRRGGNQAMRLAALGGALVSAGEVDRVVVALCAPLGHRAIWRRWAEAKLSVPLPHGVSWGELPAEGLAGAGRWPPPLWPEERARGNDAI